MPENKPKLTFICMTEYGEILDVCLRLKDEGYGVYMNVADPDHKKIGDGLVEKVTDWHQCIGKGYVWLFDGCSRGNLQDWLRSRGEKVFGGSELGDKLENDRQAGQRWFRKAGFNQPESFNFKDINSALEFIKKNADKKYILKQNSDAPKSLNHLTKFPGSEDMIFHLEELKMRWNESEYGKFDCDLMQVVEGIEIAASAFFNGTDYMKDDKGKVVGWLNFEHKKETDGDLGETTGEMGTLFYGCNETNKIFAKILMNPEIVRVLRKSGFRGIFDINGSLLPDGSFCAFEPTCRFGVPSTSYECLEAMEGNLGKVLAATAAGRQYPVFLKKGWGVVNVIAAKPYPVETDVPPEATSIGEKLWILERGKPISDFTPEQKKHIHLENFYKEDGHYRVATKNGFLLTVTGTGKDIKTARENMLAYVKDNIYLPGMKYRQDIGKKIGELKKSVV